MEEIIVIPKFIPLLKNLVSRHELGALTLQVTEKKP
jgi:hypothetical protein